MEQSWMLLFQSALLGVGLAMDAFSVSLANGLQEPKMPKGRMAWIAGVFAGFQAAMPLAGWFCVRTVAQKFTAFQRFIPWIALALLAYIGGKMLIDGLTSHGEAEAAAAGLGSTMTCPVPLPAPASSPLSPLSSARRGWLWENGSAPGWREEPTFWEGASSSPSV